VLYGTAFKPLMREPVSVAALRAVGTMSALVVTIALATTLAPLSGQTDSVTITRVVLSSDGSGLFIYEPNSLCTETS
jgi:hypothetical protein